MSGDLHMLRLDPDLAAAARWGLARGLMRPGIDDGYLWHALLNASFGPHAPKPFRLVERRSGRSHLLGYAAADKPTLVAHAQAFADPSAVEAAGLASLAVKTMPAAFTPGTRLAFEVRVRPVLRTTRNDPVRPGREIDVFLAAALAADPDATLDRTAVYGEWLAQQIAKGGALLEAGSQRLVSIRRARLLRRGAQREERPLVETGAKGGGPDLVMSGILKVVDPTAFAAMLTRGVGRHRSFGFGMLLLSPADRAL